MIDKNVKAIKESPNWPDYKKFIDGELEKLKDIQKINGEIELEANKKAVKLIEDILYIINN